MKTNRMNASKVAWTFALGVGAIAVTANTSLAGATTYTLEDLSTLAGSHLWTDPGSTAAGLSRSAIVGHSITPAFDRSVHAFRYAGGGMIDLGALPGDLHSMAFASNAQGDAVGVSFNLGEINVHGVLWPWNGGMVSLGAIEPRDINAAGAIAGSVPFTGGVAGAVGTKHAALQVGRGTTDLGTLGGPSSMGMALNESNWVVGDSMLADSRTTRAFVWRNGSMMDLGTLGGNGSRALDIDGLTVVGFADTSAARPHATRWVLNANGSIASKTDLGTLPGAQSSAAYAVSGTSIVGTSDDRAVLWTDGAIIDLNSFVDPNIYWHLTKATGIDSEGRIIGVGRHKGLTRAFVLTPKNPADIDGDGVVGQIDLALLIGAWGTNDPLADLDGNGMVGAQDLALLLGGWTA